MQKPISAARATPISIVIVTMDYHLASVVDSAASLLRKQVPGLTMSLHAAAEWENEAALSRCKAAIEAADIVICNMMFMEDHIQAILPVLSARRASCDAMICTMSAPEITKLTRIGRFDMSAPQSPLMAMMKKLRGKVGTKGAAADAGARQMKTLRRLPKILKYIPGTAQDVRVYFLALQYWLAGSCDNVTNLVRMLVDRYAAGPRLALRGTLAAASPLEYPETGVFHPRMPGRMAETAASLPRIAGRARGTVGLLIMRSYVLAGNSGHYDGVIAALEARGLNVVPAFACGLDSRPAIDRFFLINGKPVVDAVVSLTGFSLVGGPAYNDSKAAEDILASLNVPYIAAHPCEFQTLEAWERSDRGLMPLEATIMVAIPELDGSTVPMVFGGRTENAAPGRERDMVAHPERAGMLAARVDKLVALRRVAACDRKVAVVLFNFPPNAGNTGTAAFLSVFASLHNTLKAMAKAGYSVDVPASVDALREKIIGGNAASYGAAANVAHRIPASDHVRRERHLAEIEANWGPAPGRQQADGATIHVLGAHFGNVFVGIQPAFGYEGDPMRLLFEKGFTPTHAFSAFYRYIREDFGAHAALHFGTHGALEFMPGKQAGLSGACWPDRLIGDLPNLYLYAANNPSEGMIAKRRGSATLISYLTPPITQAGLYKGLAELKGSIECWRNQPQATSAAQRADVAALVQAQAAAVDLAVLEPLWSALEHDERIHALGTAMFELEYSLIPHGLHVVGAPMAEAERIDMLLAVAVATHGIKPARSAIEALVQGTAPVQAAGKAASAEMLAAFTALAGTAKMLESDTEVAALLHALEGRYIRPAPGGDLIRTPAILPTGRNLHGFDPFKIPSAFAVQDGAAQAARLLARHLADGHLFPETIALVLWGTDNLKTEGGPIAQALALMGAQPRHDPYGRVCGASLIPLDQLTRPRVDVVMTLSGIFRDLLPLQTKMLAEASYLAATADEPVEQNYVRKHALSYQAQHGCDIETAALRVFSNADGTYGANVNNLIESGRWDNEDELAETFSRRKCFAYGRSGRPASQPKLLADIMAGVSLAYQNLDSVELGITTQDQYVDSLGGISRAAKRAGGSDIPVYIGDQTSGAATVRSLGEQVALESRTRILNPKWTEGLLKHGYEGVRQIETHVTNTMGWSATTNQVAPWVYREITRTYVLDADMRKRLSDLNPHAAAKVAARLIEAYERKFWVPEPGDLEALRHASEELEDRLEGVEMAQAA